MLTVNTTPDFHDLSPEDRATAPTVRQYNASGAELATG